MIVGKGCSSSREPNSEVHGKLGFKNYFLKLLFFFKLTDWFFFRKHISLNCKRDTRTIFFPIQNSMRIYDWRLDLPVNPIEIGFTISLTIQPKIYKQVVVYGPLIPRNQLQALNLRSSRCVPVQEQV
jgi:hypothetical protein